MSEKFVERLSEAVGRRGFVRTLSAAAAAIVLGLFKTEGAGASPFPCGTPGLFPVACCCLCRDPRTCAYSGCSCEWSWTCETGIGGAGGDFCRRYTCRECYTVTPCGDSCSNIKCSRATYTTIPCL